MRKKYRDLINNRIKKIFDFKKELSAKIKIIIEKDFKEIKYMNSNDDRRFKLIKRVITSMSITTFKTIYKNSYRNIFVIINFILDKSKNK